MEATKVCSKCGIEKQVGEFYKDRCCKECVNKRSKENYKKNKARAKETGAAYRQKNRKKINEDKKEYAEKNKDKLKKYKKEYAEKNKEKIRDKSKDKYKKYYPENREKVCAYNRTYTQANRNNLDDIYLRSRLRAQGMEPTPEQIEIKREELKAYRKRMDLIQNVYFIQQRKTGPIKIGISYDPLRRMKQLQSSSGDPLYLIKVIDGGISKEQELHDKFKDIRLHHEWFEPVPELIQFISELPGDFIDKEPKTIEAKE